MSATTWDYAQKLKDPRWQRKRLEVFDRAGWKCQACGESTVTLHVHHLAYNGEPWEAEDKDLESLCADCHEFREKFDELFTAWSIWSTRIVRALFRYVNAEPDLNDKDLKLATDALHFKTVTLPKMERGEIDENGRPIGPVTQAFPEGVPEEPEPPAE